MKITTRLIVDIETGAVLARECYEYHGPIERACGGDALAGQKEQAATNQAQLSAEQAALANKAAAVNIPFFSNIAQNGLSFMPQLQDYSNGQLAQQYAPVKAGEQRQLAGEGSTLPSGFAQQQMENINEGQANAFDNQQTQNLLLNQQAKTQAASALNPAQYFSGAGSANQSILGAQPLNSGGVGNFLGGAAAGILNKASVNSAGAWTL